MIVSLYVVSTEDVMLLQSHTSLDSNPGSTNFAIPEILNLAHTHTYFQIYQIGNTELIQTGPS